MIRTTTHNFSKDINTGKKSSLSDFVIEYRAYLQACVDYIWENRFEYGSEDSIKIWDLKNNLLDCPQFISTTAILFKTRLTARATKCASTQACGIIKAVVNKRMKDINKMNFLLKNDGRIGKALLLRLEKELTKPDCKNINCEINSICAGIDFENNTSFDGWLNLKCLFNDVRGFKINIPVKHYKQSRKWEKLGILKPSFLLNKKSVQIRWEIPTPELKIEGSIIAIDQGRTTVLTCSNGWTTQKDKHSHDLTSIIVKMSKKKKGSKNFEDCQTHRNNHINWTINQLNLKSTKELKFEEIVNINYGKLVSRGMSHFTNTLIEESLTKKCEEEGVLFSLIPNEFNSQRCSTCGWVQKSNRKSKVFLCKKCGNHKDADFNAAQNILIRDKLWEIPFGFRNRRDNLKGFFWNPDGLYLDTGEVLTVPPCQN